MIRLNLQMFGGRGSRSHTTATYASFSAQSGSAAGPTNTAQMQINQVAPQQIQPTTQMAQQANAATFNDTDNSPFHDLYGGRNYFQSQAFDIDAQMAIVSMLDPNPEPGSMYSPSQNLNTALATGQKLTAQQQYVNDVMNDNMHNLGYNLNLQRYDHETFINGLLGQVGLRNADYSRMTEAQLKKALVGHTYSENRFLSTSYNNFKNAPNASQFTSRAVRIEYRAKAATQALMPGNGPGGALGEIILKPGQTMKISDVKFNGSSARQKGTQSYHLQQVTVVVDVG